MRKRFLAVLTTSVFGVSMMISIATASAATEFGDTCVGDKGIPGPYTTTTLSTPSTALPLTAPTSGVITTVKMPIDFELPILVPEQIKLLKPAGGNNFTVTTQATIKISDEVMEGGVRMPVQAGERLAIRALPFRYAGSENPGIAFYCSETPGVMGYVIEDVPPGATATFNEAPENRVPLAAIIEPDADNDGFGDETQDGCPTSAALQVSCPPVALDALSLVRKGSVAVYVATDREAPVTVNGVVPLGKGKKAKLKAAPKTVPPGKVVRFTLKFTAKLKARLKELEASKKLTMKITASATNIAGQVSTDTAKAKLKGQG
jgi:hypothetical protein